MFACHLNLRVYDLAVLVKKEKKIPIKQLNWRVVEGKGREHKRRVLSNAGNESLNLIIHLEGRVSALGLHEKDDRREFRKGVKSTPFAFVYGKIR